MKRLLSLSLLLLCSVFSFAFEVDEIAYNVTSEEKQTVEVASRQAKYSGDIVIPEKVTYAGIEYSVTSIGQSAFDYCSGLTSVTIPNSVTSIGNYAFSGCSGLTSVTIPNSVTSIGSHAFYKCYGLASIKVESGNSKYDSRNNCNAIIETSTNTLIAGCKNTTIPNSVTSIGGRAFEYCRGLTSVTIPNSVTSIGDWAFYECSGLTSVTIPNSVTSIGQSAFKDCYGLTSVTIPNSVTSIGNGAFYGCTGLTSVTIPNSVTSIGSEAFSYCDLTSVTIPNSVTSIGDWAFYGCSGLTSVTIPNSVTSIGRSAFFGCSGLTSVTIPNSVTSIGNWAFRDCSGLTEVVSLIEEPFEINERVFATYIEGNYVFTDATLFVPVGTKEKYEATGGWNLFKNIEERGIAPEDNGDVNYGGNGEIGDGTDLSGTVVGNVFYSIADGNGSYSSTEGCIVVKKPTTDEQVSQVEGTDLFGEQMKDNFTGIIFKIEPGSGTVKVTAETTGDMTLKIKIGDGAPMEFKLNGMMEAKLPYTVDVPTYVYIYAGSAEASGAKGARKAAGNGELKIYGISWGDEETDGIGIIDNGQLTIDNSPIYNLNGQRVESLQKGINIVNGKKVLVQ